MTKLAILALLVALTAHAEHGPYPGGDRTPWTPPGTRPWTPPQRPGTPLAQGIPASACFQKRSATAKEFDKSQDCGAYLTDGNAECEAKAKADCKRAENQPKQCIHAHTRFPGSWIACQSGTEKKFAAVCNWYCTDLAPRKAP